MARGSYGPRPARLAMTVALVVAALTLGACSALTSQEASTSGSQTLVSPGVPSVGGQTKGTMGYGAANDAAAPSVAPQASSGAVSSPSAAPVAKLVVVNKTMRIETLKVDDAIARIRELVARDGADIQSMQVSTAVDQPIYYQPLSDGSINAVESVPLRAYVTVRVPTDKYAAFVADAARIGKVITESETSDDVTQQHVDMQARLGNLVAEQGRLRQLFGKATSVKDMLAIEQELTRVQGDIESMQAQIKYLERQASMATVTLELTEPKAIVAPAGIDWGVQTAFTESIRAFVSTMNILIVVLGPVFALLIFVGMPTVLVLWLILRAAKRRRARRAAAVQTESIDEPTGSTVLSDEPPIL